MRVLLVEIREVTSPPAIIARRLRAPVDIRKATPDTQGLAR
jgi:hypothetical protein